MKLPFLHLATVALCAISLQACDDDPDMPLTPDVPAADTATVAPPADTANVTPADTTAVTPPAVDDGWESAAQAVAAMRVGWNLGNTLDSHSNDTTNLWIEKYTDRSPRAYETAWGQPQATRQLIHMFAEAGFGAIRVPVTWYPHIDADGIVDEAWMARVEEVVGYVLDEGLYCILNVHHDTGADNVTWVKADEEQYARTRHRYETLWTQIATRFATCDHHLVFEGYNEMLDVKNSWNSATTGMTAYNGLNSYAQSFVDAVRATGGNNARRNLVVSTYAAACGGTWNANLNLVLSTLRIPDDPASGHIMVEVHNYTPWEWDKNHGKWTDSHAREVATDLARVKSYFVDKGYPVIIGEYGATASGPEDEAEVAKYARSVVSEARKYGMTTFYWMGLSDGADRTVPRWTLPKVKDAIIDAAPARQ